MNNENSQIEKNQNDITKNTITSSKLNECKDIGNLEGEVWKDVISYEGFYKVSNYGRIRGLERLDSWSRKIEACMLTLCNGPHGYSLVSLAYNGKRTSQKVHRLVAKAFIPNPENKPHINHKDGNKQNNYIENLEWCTAKENVIHSLKTGLSSMKRFIGHTHAKHEKNGRARINMKIANAIREDRELNHYTLQSLSEKYNISRTQVGRIVNKHHWI